MKTEKEKSSRSEMKQGLSTYLEAIIKLICRQLYAHKFDMLWTMYIYQLPENQVPKHNQSELDKLTRLITLVELNSQVKIPLQTI